MLLLLPRLCVNEATCAAGMFLLRHRGPAAPVSPGQWSRRQQPGRLQSGGEAEAEAASTPSSTKRFTSAVAPARWPGSSKALPHPSVSY